MKKAYDHLHINLKLSENEMRMLFAVSEISDRTQNEIIKDAIQYLCGQILRDLHKKQTLANEMQKELPTLTTKQLAEVFEFFTERGFEPDLGDTCQCSDCSKRRSLDE